MPSELIPSRRAIASLLQEWIPFTDTHAQLEDEIKKISTVL